MNEILAHMSQMDRVDCRLDLDVLGYYAAEKISDDPPHYRQVDPNLVTYDHKTKAYMVKG